MQMIPDNRQNNLQL